MTEETPGPSEKGGPDGTFTQAQLDTIAAVVRGVLNEALPKGGTPRPDGGSDSAAAKGECCVGIQARAGLGGGGAAGAQG